MDFPGRASDGAWGRRCATVETVRGWRQNAEPLQDDPGSEDTLRNGRKSTWSTVMTGDGPLSSRCCTRSDREVVLAEFST